MNYMFKSRNFNAIKKKFQKPNILRKNAKFNNMTYVQQEQKAGKFQVHKNNVDSTPQLLLTNYTETEEAVSSLSSTTSNKIGESIPSPVSYAEFLNNGDSQTNLLFDIDVSLSQDIEADDVEKFCLDNNVIGESDIFCSENYDKFKNEDVTLEPDAVSTMVPLSAVTLSNIENKPQIEYAVATPSIPKSSFPKKNIVKCSIPNCNKEFMSECKLKAHMKIHNTITANTVSRLSNYDCPGLRREANGESVVCGRVFRVRVELLKHLKEEHTIDDAAYKCEECGRQFFWAPALRVHARVHARGAGALACAWPGCGRVFRQPCRLREHTRAHTGDKPYPCNYPNCGWSFRTASKLVRHSRRHTGERRHACALCARAFLRREHLRDHAAKHLRTPTPCPHSHCQQKFYTVKSFNRHLKRSHRLDETETNLVDIVENETFKIEHNDEFKVSLSKQEMSNEDGTLSLEFGLSDSEGEAGRAARTHCTWPLPARASASASASASVTEPISASSPTLLFDDTSCVLEDVKVAHLEGGESNVYTIRSDLFLHSNVLYNDDSQSMEESAGPGGAGLDAELGLDAHAHDAHDTTTIDLMQEQLMFTDAAVDESSFRVFLLNGEELSL